MKLYSTLGAALLTAAFSFSTAAQEPFVVEEVADGLKHPWGMAFLPNGEALITERAGFLRKMSVDGTLSAPISGLPDVVATGQGGMLGIALDPDFADNRKVYVCMNIAGNNGWGSEVHVGTFDGNALTDVSPIFVAQPKYESRHHFGCRIAFDNDGFMFISLGDRGGYKEQAQDPQNHIGTVVRLDSNGNVPDDNPFVSGNAPEVFTYGHRNVQGMALHPTSGEVWTHEHGPKGGDEVNVLAKGNNYGWPVITYGTNYDGSIITDQTQADGMQQPLHYWDPSFAPSGMMFYTGDAFPKWQGDLFMGSLKFRYLKRVKVDSGKIVEEENLLQEQNARIRDVVQGPSGDIYVLTDAPNGKVLKVTKKQS